MRDFPIHPPPSHGRSVSDSIGPPAGDRHSLGLRSQLGSSSDGKIRKPSWMLPGLVNIQKTNWKDPPFSSWVNPLFRLGHGFNSFLYVYQRVHGLTPTIGNIQMSENLGDSPGVTKQLVPTFTSFHRVFCGNDSLNLVNTS